MPCCSSLLSVHFTQHPSEIPFSRITPDRHRAEPQDRRCAAWLRLRCRRVRGGRRQSSEQLTAEMDAVCISARRETLGDGWLRCGFLACVTDAFDRDPMAVKSLLFLFPIFPRPKGLSVRRKGLLHQVLVESPGSLYVTARWYMYISHTPYRFRSHPVFHLLSNRGKMCASVLKTTSCSGI